jgi:hypothetical protein
MSPSPSSLLTPQEAAQRLGPNGVLALTALVQEGRLPAYRFRDGNPGFLTADVEAITRPMPASEAVALLSQHGPPQTSTPAIPAQLTLEFRRMMRQVLEQEQAQQAQRLRWASAKQVAIIFGIDRDRLMTWVMRGMVKQAKLGRAQQAASLFKVEDIERILENIAVGKLDPEQP